MFYQCLPSQLFHHTRNSPEVILFLFGCRYHYFHRRVFHFFTDKSSKSKSWRFHWKIFYWTKSSVPCVSSLTEDIIIHPFVLHWDQTLYEQTHNDQNKERSNWTRVQTHSSDKGYEKFNQSNMWWNQNLKFYPPHSKCPTPLSSHCLAEFFTGTHTYTHTHDCLVCKQTSSWPATGRQGMSPPPALNTGRKGEGGGGWWQKQVGRKGEWRERVDSHVSGSSCSVDGKREIQQPQTGMMDVVFITPHFVAYSSFHSKRLTGEITGVLQSSLMCGRLTLIKIFWQWGMILIMD